MRLVLVGVFHDQKRIFLPQEVNVDNINAIEEEITLMWGPDGPNLTQKVTMAGAHLYVRAADTPRLKS